MSENTYFEKHRDLLIQEIGISMESVIYHLDTLNRSLTSLISVGKEFDDVARLWSHFYDGARQLKERKLENGTDLQDIDSEKEEAEGVAREEDELYESAEDIR